MFAIAVARLLRVPLLGLCVVLAHQSQTASPDRDKSYWRLAWSGPTNGVLNSRFGEQEVHLSGGVGLVKDAIGFDEPIREGPCWGYVAFGVTKGDDIISVEQMHRLAKKNGLDLCMAESESKGPGMKSIRFCALPDAWFKAGLALAKDAELSQLVVNLVADVPVAVPTLPASASVWRSEPQMRDVKERFLSEGEAAWRQVQELPAYVRLAQHEPPSRSAMVIRSVKFPRVGGAFDLFFDFGKQGAHRFQVLPPGPVVDCGQIDRFPTGPRR